MISPGHSSSDKDDATDAADDADADADADDGDSDDL